MNDELVKLTIEVPQWIASAIGEVLQFVSDPEGRPTGDDVAVCISAGFASCAGRTSLSGARCRMNGETDTDSVHGGSHVLHAYGAAAGCAEAGATQFYGRLVDWVADKPQELRDLVAGPVATSFTRAAKSSANRKTGTPAHSYDEIKEKIRRRPPAPPAIEGEN